MDRYDSIIVGAGHNGLICAAYLAQSGQRVLVLEASAAAGGLAATREFHPGYRANIAHAISHFSTKVAADLSLSTHDLAAQSNSMPTIGLKLDGQHLSVTHDALSGCSPRDSSSFGRYSAMMRRFAAMLEPFWLRTMPRIGDNSLSEMMTFAKLGLDLRRLGKKDMREFLRIVSLPVRDLMDEFFTDEALKATLSWDGLIGSKMAPRSPNGAILSLLYRTAAASHGAQVSSIVDVNKLVETLHLSATASGASVRFNAPVDRILVEGNAEGLRTSGVQLASGEKITANNVISSADPKTTFLKLVGVQYLDIGFTNRIRRLRCDGYVGKLHLALNSLPEFKGLTDANGRLIIAPDMDAVEFAFDDAKYGACSKNPVMEIVLPSLGNAALAPNGHHVLSAQVMYVPYRLKGGWTGDARADISERAIANIANYAPGIRDLIVHAEFLSPWDIEQEYRATGGHWHHTELAMDQMLMMRPTYEAAQYKTPIPGLFLSGAGCHPGGDLTGAVGHNAAQAVLR